MRIFSANKISFAILKQNGLSVPIYPYIRDNSGSETMFCISPVHGRSFVVMYSDFNTIVTKGNGLSYTSNTFLHTKEHDCYSWGLLLKEDAIRDFNLGIEIQKLGIKTNTMQYVLELDYEFQINKDTIIKPVLLQYSVECPYRICDFQFTPKQVIDKELQNWEILNKNSFSKKHLIAADVMVSNLRIMHDNNILHNAIHNQNYTWALELLDFELARSNTYPYIKDDYEQQYPVLFEREVIQTYDIINYVAWCLDEPIDYCEIDEIFNCYNYKI